ncbi:hypothetical protein ACG7TL_006166 [Trametes sanguinea]
MPRSTSLRPMSNRMSSVVLPVTTEDEMSDAELPSPQERSADAGRQYSLPPSTVGSRTGTMLNQSVSSARLPNVASSSKRQRAGSATSEMTTHGQADPTLGYTREVRLCQMTDEEKLAFTNRKGKLRQDRPYTAWFESSADEPRAHPPDLTALSELTVGDLFWHKSLRGIQLWIWLETPEHGKLWKPVLLGYKRDSDERKLTLTPSDKPSWAKDPWYRKRDKKTSKTLVFIYNG